MAGSSFFRERKKGRTNSPAFMSAHRMNKTATSFYNEARECRNSYLKSSLNLRCGEQLRTTFERQLSSLAHGPENDEQEYRMYAEPEVYKAERLTI